MTLPFRRRHNDAEVSHDRARSLISTGFLQQLDGPDAAWLAAHLSGCRLCTSDAEAYAADRELLRGLRDQSPQPPRDLWARTAAGLQQEGPRRSRRVPGRGVARGGSMTGWRFGRVPVGVLAAAVVIVVVVGVSLAPHDLSPGPSGPPGSDVAVATPYPGATPFSVTADALVWIQVGANGSYDLRRAPVDSVCPDVHSGCATLESGSITPLALTQAPQAVIQSPSGSEIVVVTSPSSLGGAEVVVVPVPTIVPNPTSAPTSSGPATTASPTPVATPEPTPRSTPTAPRTAGPSPSPISSATTSVPPTASAGPTPSVSPAVGHAIVTGVTVVGDAAYSPDGTWLAFSARPADGSSGPDLYLWHVGDDHASAVTSNHRTFFAAWLGNKVLANVVVPTIPLSPPGAPLSSPQPDASAQQQDVSAQPSMSAEPSAPVEEHPIAVTIDPETHLTTIVAAQDMWLPTVDPTGRTVVYWAGTVTLDASGTGWALGSGRLVLDGWQSGTLVSAPNASGAPAATRDRPHDVSPTATPSGGSAGSPNAAGIGPAGHPVTITEGPSTGFDAAFDPTGLRLAVWLADASDPGIGTLRLIVLDPVTLQIDPATDPLPAVAALRGISISEGRLAWVTPPGQDGQGSHVQVLGWRGASFGQIRTIQAGHLFVVR